MIPSTQQEILRRLADLCELSPGIRTGQLLSHLNFLSDDMFDRPLAEVEDAELLQVLKRHETELVQRKSNVA
jgi:hypothetical protein